MFLTQSGCAEKSSPIIGLRTIGVAVPDIEATIAFYEQVYPMAVVARYTVDAEVFGALTSDLSDSTVQVAEIELPNVYLRLFDFSAEKAPAGVERPVYQAGFNHMALISPLENDAYAQFGSAGMEYISRGDAPVDIRGVGYLYAYGRDPNGTMVELEMAPEPIRSGDFWVGHIATVTPDIDRLVAFYESLLGYDVRTTLSIPKHPRLDDVADLDGVSINGAWFVLRNIELELWSYVKPETVAYEAPPLIDRLGYNLMTFEVTDLKAGIAHLKAQGIPIIGEPSNVAGWDIAYFRDPDGNLLALEQRSKSAVTPSIAEKAWIDVATFGRE
ncbi:MAG: VOC family protein [Pseudomonadota bacterium]